MDIYVLQGETGEYADRYERIYGVFLSEPEALSALAEIPRVSDEGYRAYKDFEARCQLLAAAEGAPRVATYILDHTEEERDAWRRNIDKMRELESRLGPKPTFICTSDRYWITRFRPGEIGDGVVVFDTEESTAQAA